MWGNILLLKKLKKHQTKRRVQDINHELLQCDDCIDSNIAHHYYANIKKKFKIPALWVLLKFLGQVPIGKNFNFLDIKNRYLAPCAS